jgi:hypothetical protein
MFGYEKFFGGKNGSQIFSVKVWVKSPKSMSKIA